MSSDFYKYFKENMDGLNLDCPDTLFNTSGKAISTANTILSAIKQFGKQVTVAELAAAGNGLEKLAYLNTLQASFYAGAVIGSIAVATGRTLAGGTSLSDVLLYARMNHISTPWLPATLRRYPGIVNPKVRTRSLHVYSMGPR